MSWHRVDDGFTEHPKLAALEHDPRLWADALALWLAAACYCRRADTGGLVSHERLVRLSPLAPKRAKAVAQALVSQARTATSTAGLWVEVEGGYRFHDWDTYGPGPTGGGAPLTDAQRAKRYRSKRHGAVTDSVTERDAEAVTNRDGERDAERDGERHGERHESHVTASVTPRADAAARPRPVPSRPVATTNVVAAPVTATTTGLASSDTLAVIAEAAYVRAIEAAGGIATPAPKWRPDLVSVGRLAEAHAAKHGGDLRTTLGAWAKRYVSEREQRRPDWWLERVTAWAGATAERGADTDELARLRAALDALEPARNRAVTAGARGVGELARIEAEQDAIRVQIRAHRERTNNPNPIARAS